MLSKPLRITRSRWKPLTIVAGGSAYPDVVVSWSLLSLQREQPDSIGVRRCFAQPLRVRRFGRSLELTLPIEGAARHSGERMFATCFEERTPRPYASVRAFNEKQGQRKQLLKTLHAHIVEHYVGLATVAQAGGLKKAANIIRNSLPRDKRKRSGDIGELIAMEFINSQTTFQVPIPKLRWKSDQESALHGTDIVAIKVGKKTQLMKGEVKSAIKITKGVIDEAVAALDGHQGRPNPSTIAFITKRLYELKRDDEAHVFRDLQAAGAMKASMLVQGIFTLSGNDPTSLLANVPAPKVAGIARSSAALIVDDHAGLVAAAFDGSNGKEP